MSIVEIKCPRCGSADIQEGTISNEYICSHCGKAFRLIDNTKKTVTVAKDVVTHGCVYCGKAIEAGKGFRCTTCQREYFCQSCVDLVRHKYVCIECISKAGNNCQLCEKYSPYKCVSCGRKACKVHAREMGFLRFVPDGKGENVEGVLFCPRCNGFICNSCAKHRIFSGTRCPKCDTELIGAPALAL